MIRPPFPAAIEADPSAKVCARLVLVRSAKDEALRLQFGEMTAAEIRTLRAVLAFIARAGKAGQ